MGVGRKCGSADSKDTLWGRVGLIGACTALSRSHAPSSPACRRYRCCAEHLGSTGTSSKGTERGIALCLRLTSHALPGSCLSSLGVAANVAAAASAIAVIPMLRWTWTLHHSGARLHPWVRVAGCATQAYLAAELAWYCFCESEKKRFEPLVPHAAIGPDQRQVLWQRCLRWSRNPRLWIQGWFNNIDTFERITRPDILDFLAWGFWGIRARELAPSDTKQLEAMVSELEHAVSTEAAPHYSFPPQGAACFEAKLMWSPQMSPCRQTACAVCVAILCRQIFQKKTLQKNININ